MTKNALTKSNFLEKLHLTQIQQMIRIQFDFTSLAERKHKSIVTMNKKHCTFHISGKKRMAH